MVKNEKWQEIKKGMYVLKDSAKPHKQDQQVSEEFLKELKENSGVWRYILGK